MKEGEKETLEEIDELVRIKREIYFTICEKLLKMCEAALSSGTEMISVKAEILYRILRERSRLIRHLTTTEEKDKSEDEKPKTATIRGGLSKLKKMRKKNPTALNLPLSACPSRKDENVIAPTSPPSSERMLSDKILLFKYDTESTRMLRAIEESPKFIIQERLDRFPRIDVNKLRSDRPLSIIKGPGDSSLEYSTFGTFASAKSISNYPCLPGRPSREGDPICDRYYMKIFENRIIFALADGCNWGERPRKAAKRASKMVIDYVEKYMSEVISIKSAAALLMLSFAEAHNRINQPKYNINYDVIEPGTTTLIAGLLLQVPPGKSNVISNDQIMTSECLSEFGEEIPILSSLPPPPSSSSSVQSPSTSPSSSSLINTSSSKSRWVLVYVNLGDCKIYHYNAKTEKISDLTGENRISLDPTDPGGRLGGSNPDLRNYDAGFHFCQEGDLIFAVSDGVHDNFEPFQLGVTPRDVGLGFDKWDDERAREHQVNYMTEKLKGVIEQGGSPFTPQSVVETTISYSHQITQKSRDFMQNFPRNKLPNDYTLYPGKLDHSTCLCFRVGTLNLSFLEYDDQNAAEKKKDSNNIKPPPASNNNHASIETSPQLSALPSDSINTDPSRFLSSHRKEKSVGANDYNLMINSNIISNNNNNNSNNNKDNNNNTKESQSQMVDVLDKSISPPLPLPLNSNIGNELDGKKPNEENIWKVYHKEKQTKNNLS